MYVPIFQYCFSKSKCWLSTVVFYSYCSFLADGYISVLSGSVAKYCTEEDSTCSVSIQIYLRIIKLYSPPVRDDPKNVICTPSQGSITVFTIAEDSLRFMQNTMGWCLFATVNMSVCVCARFVSVEIQWFPSLLRNLGVDQIECSV